MSQMYDPTTGINFNAGHASDQGVFAEFYVNAVQNNAETEKQGRPIFDDKLYIRIRTPGDRKNEVDREAKDADKMRFAFQWAQYQQGATAAASGTPLEEWPLMTPATVKTLKYFGIASVDQMAAVTDGNLQNLGPGMRSVRDAAIAYLERAGEGAGTRALAAENAELRERLAAMEANLTSLTAAVRAKEAKDGASAG